MDYNHQMVILARESRGMSQTELANHVGMPQGTLSKLESGDFFASEEPIRAIGRVLKYPVSFFQQTDTVYPFGARTFYHRKQQSMPSSVLRRIEARVNIYRFHIMRLLRSTDLDSRNRFNRIDPEEHHGRIEKIAESVRAGWRVGNGPVVNLVRLIEDNGGIVVRFRFGTVKMSGLSEWIPPAPPLFFLNDDPDISADRDRFTLAHELGHVVLHNLPNPNMEQEANRFAAEFLMPSSELRQQLRAPVKLHTVAKLKPYWKVSMASLLSRARDLGVMNENQFVYQRIQLQNKGYLRREPPELDIPREMPSLLSEVVREHIHQLGYNHGDLARMLHMELAEFRSCYGLNDDRGGLRAVMA
jgi:Zn-dependent peptidase ImmA (M78 family)/transcriptional regulator with XRE-family HTH domain